MKEIIERKSTFNIFKNNLTESDMSSSENIRVICRFRPLSKEEEQNKNVFVPTFSTKLNQVHFSENTFQFDKVLTDVSSQNNVYGAAAARTVQDAINGVNGTIFAYGQTGSGKTHTMNNMMDKMIDHMLDKLRNEMPAKDTMLGKMTASTMTRFASIKCIFRCFV